MKVVVVRAGALGDMVCTLPALASLRRVASELVVVAASRYRPLFPAADAWLDVDGAAGLGLFGGRLAEATGADLGVAWTPSAAAALRACGVARVVEGTATPRSPVHAIDHLWEPLRGIAPPPTPPRLAIPPRASRRLARALEGLGGAPVVLSPGSGGARKRWPLARWREVANRLTHPVVWVSGPVERDEAGWGAPRWDDLDLAALICLADRSRAWLAPDSGPAHLAAAAGARVGVVFNGATDPRCWAPPGATVWGADATPAALAAWADAAGDADGVGLVDVR